MVTFEEIDGKLVPKGNEEDIKAYLAYKKGQKQASHRRSLRKRLAQHSSAFQWLNDHMPLSRLDRYIVGKFLGTYFFSIILIISIAVVFDFNENIDKFLQHDAPIEEIVFDYYLNFIPFYSNLFSQLFVFIAVIFFTTKLADNSEIIAMLSTGTSFARLIRPYMIAAAIIALINYGLGSYVIPKGNVKRVRFENKYKNRGRQDFTSNVQLEVEPGVIAYFGRYEESMKTAFEFTLDKFVDKKLVSHLQSMTIQYDTLLRAIPLGALELSNPQSARHARSHHEWQQTGYHHQSDATRPHGLARHGNDTYDPRFAAAHRTAESQRICQHPTV